VTVFAELFEARRGDTHRGLVDERASMTWDEVVTAAGKMAAWLETKRQDGPAHVGVLLPNGIDYVLWIFAAAMARWTVVGINPTRRGDALALDIKGVDCQFIITNDEMSPMLDGLDLGPANGRIVTTDDARAASAGFDPLFNAGAIDEDLLLLLFTSGTTGVPKAVRCTQGRLGNISVTASQVYQFTRDDVCYCPMPLFHGNAVMAMVAPALNVGATIVLPKAFSASNFLPDVRKYQATRFTYVGKSIAYILATAQQPDDHDNTLQRAFGTEASSPDRIAFQERFGCPLTEGYGSSEGAVAILTTPDTPKGSLGPAPPNADLAIIDPDTGIEMERARFDDGGQLLNGTEAIGEIVARAGYGKFEGYYKNEDAENSRLRNGWYWTGDLAYRDEAGFFYFAGRGGDWLRVDSENLAAAPVENVMARFHAFASVGVYPVPDPAAGAGDLVMAAVELREGIFDPQEFSSWWDDQGDAGTKWKPQFIRITTKIDETATGKITKVLLKQDAWHTSDVVWYRPSRSTSYEILTGDHVKALDAQLKAQRGSSAIS